MGVTQECGYGSTSIWRTGEVSVDGIVSDSREMLHVGWGSVEARLASATAYSFSDRGIFSNTMDPKQTIILWTKARYLVILSSFVSYALFTYKTMSWESLYTFTCVTKRFRARRKPTRKASYSASLFDVGNENWTVCKILVSSSDLSIILALPRVL